MKSSIRPLASSDLESVLVLSKELGYPSEIEELKERFNILTKKDHHAIFIYDEGSVIGFIHLECVDDLIEERKLEIKALVVNENARGKGIGKALVEEAKKWAKKRELHTIYLNCNILRDRTHAFYLREGFTKVKTSHFFEIEV